jgi:hypothetical protein
MSRENTITPVTLVKQLLEFLICINNQEETADRVLLTSAKVVTMNTSTNTNTFQDASHRPVKAQELRHKDGRIKLSNRGKCWILWSLQQTSK